MNKYTYISKELAEKTNKKSIKNAYERGNLTITVIDGKFYYFEATDSRYQKTINAEIKKHFPELTPLY